MALIVKELFRKKEKIIGKKHAPVSAAYSVFSVYGETIFQIETYGSIEREMIGRVSQNIQINKEMAKELIKELKEAFDL